MRKTNCPRLKVSLHNQLMQQKSHVDPLVRVTELLCSLLVSPSFKQIYKDRVPPCIGLYGRSSKTSGGSSYSFLYFLEHTYYMSMYIHTGTVLWWQSPAELVQRRLPLQKVESSTLSSVKPMTYQLDACCYLAWCSAIIGQIKDWFKQYQDNVTVIKRHCIEGLVPQWNSTMKSPCVHTATILESSVAEWLECLTSS